MVEWPWTTCLYIIKFHQLIYILFKHFGGSIWQTEHCACESKRQGYPCKILAGGRHAGRCNGLLILLVVYVYLSVHYYYY